MLRDVRGKWGKGLAVALAVSGLLLFAGCGNKQAQQKAPAAFPDCCFLPGAVINRRSRKRRLQWRSRPCR